MTEQEWLTCGDPDAMVDAVPRPNNKWTMYTTRPAKRKKRLLACGIARRAVFLWTDPRSQAAVEVAEQYADGVVSWEALTEARRHARSAAQACLLSGGGGEELHDPRTYAARAAENAAAYELRMGGYAMAAVQFALDLAGVRTYQEERSLQVQLVRCVFGNPFRPVRIDPAWRR